MTVTRRLAAILAADCDEISETGLLVDPEGTYRAFRRMSAHWGESDSIGKLLIRQLLTQTGRAL